ncbi:lytic transglycosylase domain-containing protein [Desulfurispora thermophila]|uniref:lytic transglycosylase domain-containing protein n=1 Tax=Desulfurispora thermophila TaxID=265470 RepID=UPI0003632783|nr:lytic transglycosylase domain-containing protein [Desulfurispora thermophila]
MKRRTRYKAGPRARRYLLLLILLALLIANRGHIARLLFPIPYSDLIHKYSVQHGVDPLLIAAMIKVESNFNPRAISPKGARGLMQLMPGTAVWIARHMPLTGYTPQCLNRPDCNIQLGTWYVHNLLLEFDHSTPLMLAAYNGGRGNVRQWLDRHWDGSWQSALRIPFPETRRYVYRVLWHYKLYQLIYGRIAG